jgi:hypothetical protein
MPICSASACSPCEGLIASSPYMPWTDGVRVSRMREICTSGLKRAEEARAPPLRYSAESRIASAHELRLHELSLLHSSDRPHNFESYSDGRVCPGVAGRHSSRDTPDGDVTPTR